MENTNTMNGQLGDHFFEFAKQTSQAFHKDIAEKYIIAAEHYLKDKNYKLSGLSYEKAFDIYEKNGNEELAVTTAIKAVNSYKELPILEKCLNVVTFYIPTNKLEKCEKLLNKVFTYYINIDKCKAADQNVLLAQIYEMSIENDSFIKNEERYSNIIKLYEQAWSYYKDGGMSEVIKGFDCLKTASYIAIKNYQYTKALALLELLDTDKRYHFAEELLIDMAIVKLYISGIVECREWFFIKHDTRSSYYNIFSTLIVNYNQANQKGFLRSVQYYNSWQKKLLLEVSTRMM
jgi:hypothetical protein